MTKKYASNAREYRKSKYNNLMKIMGHRLSMLRQKKGYSLQHLAKVSHVNVNTIYKIERGDVDVSFLTLVSLVGALGYKLDEFIGSLYLRRSTVTGKATTLWEKSDSALRRVMLKILEHTYADWNYCKTCPRCEDRDRFYDLEDRLKDKK